MACSCVNFCPPILCEPPTLRFRPPLFLQTPLTSSAISFYNATPGKNSRKFCLQLKNSIDFKATQQQPSSRLKSNMWLAVPMLANLLLPSVATALDRKGSSSFQELLQFLSLADLDPSVAGLLMRILGPVFASLNFLFIIRIVMSWYPQLPVDKFPYIIAFAPTEPVLEPTRKLIPPVGGVDVSPVIWVALMSFLNEILLGQQGLLVLLSEQRG